MGSKARDLDLKDVLQKCRPDLQPFEALYKTIHARPELSHQEEETASLVVQHLKKLVPDIDIRTRVGGHGVVGILKNGEGRTLLLRAELDALPIKEDTGLPYSSSREQVDANGKTTPVAHACGHDMHMACLLLAAKTLASARDYWSGTLVLLFQPAEEAGDGALGMINDGLYEGKHNCPIPDLVLGQHVGPLRAGSVFYKDGTVLPSADTFDVTIYGRSAHGSAPHLSIDPIVIACHIIVRLQTIVSRTVPPFENAVITVGTINGGQAHNIISDHASFTINVRTSDDQLRLDMIKRVRKVIEAECAAAFCEKSPLIEHKISMPLTANLPTKEFEIPPVFKEVFGNSFSIVNRGHLASEDFSVLARSIQKPYFYWFIGGFDSINWDALAKAGQLHTVPFNHSPQFTLAIHPTLQTGGDTFAVAALAYLGRK